MPHSYSTQTDLTCSNCTRTFLAEIWLIVDTAEQPDLVERIRRETLHTVSCPHCHQQRRIDAPLLLYRPGQKPPLLFSPAQATTSEQDQGQAIVLMGLLRGQLGSAWQDSLLAAGVPGVPRPVLATTLSDDPATALRHTTEKAQVAKETRARSLLQVLQQFIWAESWTASQQVVEQQPELLSDEADTLLGQLITTARQRGNDQAVHVFEEHRKLLQHSRKIGVAAAFAEKREPSFQDDEPLEADLEVPTEFIKDLVEAAEAGYEYGSTGDPRLLDTAIAAWERILNDPSFTRAPEHFRLNVLNDAGCAFLYRYEARSYPTDLDQALKLWKGAAASMPSSSPDRLTILNNLGSGLHNRYTCLGQREDLEEAIQMHRQVLAATSFDSPDRPLRRANLGTSLLDRYMLDGRLEDLEEAIGIWRDVAAAMPLDSSERLQVLSNLGGGLRERYLQIGQLEDLEKAIELYKNALVTIPSDSPYLHIYLGNLGPALYDYYLKNGQLEDLEEAIRVSQQAVAATPHGFLERPGYLTNLGNGLSSRYALVGRLEDLEMAIKVYQQAVEATPSNSPDLPVYLANLGAGLYDRYMRTLRLNDLEEIIRVYQRTVELISPNAPARPIYLTSLGLGLFNRYKRTGKLEDLEEAIHLSRQAVVAAPLDMPDRSLYLSNLGTCLRDRYAQNKHLEDLEEAIHLFQQAVAAATSPNAPRWPMYLNNLGTGLSDRYARTGDLKDLEEAIQVYQQAAEVTPLDFSDRPSYLENLGNGLYEHYLHTKRPEDLKKAVQVYEEILSILDRTFLFSTTTYQLGQQVRWADFYAQTVALHYQADHLTQAVTMAEGSKSRLMTSLLSRGDLPAPLSVPPPLLSQEQNLAVELAALDAVDLTSHSRLTTPQTETERLARLERRQSLVGQLTSLWQEMISYDQGAVDYVALRRGDRPDWDDLQQLAGHLEPQTAILSIFTLPDRVLLFVLKADQPIPSVIEVTIPDTELRYNYLMNYEDEVLNRWAYRAAGRPLTHRWRMLGVRLLAPVLPQLEGISHLVIVPHSLFHYLPLHALALNETGETLLDHLTVSYIPALGLLARLRNRPPVKTRNAFVLGYTPADSTTPAGAIERNIFLGEAQVIAAQMKVSPCLDQQATTSQLQAALTGQSLALVHLSCHGGFDPIDPLRSGVLLADGLFTARQWMELHFQADLVTLSACQTALTGSLGGDELAGLSQVLLYAGASALLLGLWSVNALTTQVLMTDFYRRLWDGNGQKRTDEATALREATLALRRGELLSSEEGFDLTDPYYWAPFVLIGDWR